MIGHEIKPFIQNYTKYRTSPTNYFNGQAPQKRCFNCGSTAHFRNNCTILAWKKNMSNTSKYFNVGTNSIGCAAVTFPAVL